MGYGRNLFRAHSSDEGRVLLGLSQFFDHSRTLIAALERTLARRVTAIGLTFTPSDLRVKSRRSLRELEGSALAIKDRHVGFLRTQAVRDYLQRVHQEDRLFNWYHRGHLIC